MTHKQTTRFTKTFWIMMAILEVAIVGGSATILYLGTKSMNQVLITPPATGGFVLVLMLLLSRVTGEIHADKVVARLGPLFKKVIPRDEIERVEVEAYNWKEFGGWGWKHSFKGSSTYSAVGVKSCVRLFLKGNRSFVLSCEDPQAFKKAYDGPSSGSLPI